MAKRNPLDGPSGPAGSTLQPLRKARGLLREMITQQDADEAHVALTEFASTACHILDRFLSGRRKTPNEVQRYEYLRIQELMGTCRALSLGDNSAVRVRTEKALHLEPTTELWEDAAPLEGFEVRIEMAEGGHLEALQFTSRVTDAWDSFIR